MYTTNDFIKNVLQEKKENFECIDSLVIYFVCEEKVKKIKSEVGPEKAKQDSDALKYQKTGNMHYNLLIEKFKLNETEIDEIKDVYNSSDYGELIKVYDEIKENIIDSETLVKEVKEERDRKINELKKGVDIKIREIFNATVDQNNQLKEVSTSYKKDFKTDITDIITQKDNKNNLERTFSFYQDTERTERIIL